MSAAVSASSSATTFDRGRAVTKSLLGWGVVAGPFYVVVGLAQALLVPGFDLSRHALSLLLLGPLGWIQALNLVLSGLMVLAAAIGFARLMPRRAQRLGGRVPRPLRRQPHRRGDLPARPHGRLPGRRHGCHDGVDRAACSTSRRARSGS